jgi:NAD(P)H-hydrate epimerase
LQELNCDALAIGCGIGKLDTIAAGQLIDWIDQSTTPAVIDADALNLIAKSNRVSIFKDYHILTPHPGEFARLAPDLVGMHREAAARAFTQKVPATLLLKGGRSIITRAGQALWCNATGSPGMATGGQGDLLSGVIAARLAIGSPPMEAAALGAWLCGRASEIAQNDPALSVESLTPSDTARQLGAAYRNWKSSRR